MTDTWSDALTGMPLERPRDPGGRVLVLSAHPDDEVLAVGAWLACQITRPIEFVTATDGEASHPESSAVTPEELRERRPRELLDALHHLGFADPVVRRLGLPDGGLTESRDELQSSLEPMIRAADRWRAIKFTDFERRQIAAVREDLDSEYQAQINAPTHASATPNPSRLSSSPRT